MLRLILGPAGSGKTVAVYEEIARRAQAGKPAILIVPEQYSFESERALCDRLGERLALTVQVLSFTRLCHKIFYRYGQVAGNFIDQTGRYLLMSLAVEQVRDQLTLYRTQAGRASFVPVALDLIGELKNAGAAPDDVFAAAEGCADQRLHDKLRELGLLYGAYQALVERSYRDPADDIARAVALSAGKGFFAGTAVYIDSFTAFMAPELQMIGQMIAEADEVAVTSCLPGPGGVDADSVFAPCAATVRRLTAAAHRAGVPVRSPMVLTRLRRAQSDALAHLVRCYLQGDDPYEEDQDTVRCVEAGDVFDEIRYIAREIVELTHDRGLRYREIAVITRNLAPYEQAVCDIFAEYGIPVYLDRRENVESFDVINLVLCALLSVRGGFDTAQLISLSKIPLLGIEPEDAFELENYCFVWNVRGRLWQNPFTNHPDGLAAGGEMAQGAKDRLRRVERARQRLIEPLAQLRDALRDPTGASFARGVYAYLERSGALGRLRALDTVEAQREYVDIQSALYDSLIDILDLFHALLGEQRFSLTRLIELWRLAVASCDVGKLPQTLDQVIVGTADRIRPAGIRAAFVCGCVENEFPLRFSGAGLLTDREREALREGGAPLALNVARTDLVGLERFYTYFAVTVPSERLYVTYPSRATGGDEKRPSAIVRSVLSMFPGCLRTTARQDLLRGVRTRENAFELLCRTWRSDTPLHATLAEWFAGSAQLCRLERAQRSVEDKNFQIEDRAVSRRLFGRLMSLSPSRLEQYYGCAFAYFCQGGLHLRKRRRVEYSPLESGSLIHYILEVLVRRYCAGGAQLPPDAALRGEIAALIHDYLAERIEDPSTVDRRFKYLFTRLCGTLARLTRRLWEEFGQSAFRPYAFELPISPEDENKPVVLETPGGSRVYVRGIVDRVDLLESAQGRYLRVVDYKSGAKSFHLADVYYGLNMQMLIYLFTLSQNGDKTLRGAFPAGVLYMPAREDAVTVERGASPEEAAALHADGYRMDGLLLDNIPVLERMEKDLSGVFIPVRRRRDGSLDSLSKVAGLEEFGRLRRHIEKLVCEMADGLIEGRVGALPSSGLGYDPCALCDFRTVCRREEQHPKRVLAQMRPEELFALLREEEQKEEGGTGDDRHTDRA